MGFIGYNYILGIPWQSSGQDSRVFTPKGVGSIPGWGTKIPKAAQCGQKNSN